MTTLRAADLFCGAGGTSCGAESTGAARVAFAHMIQEPEVVK